MYRKVNSTIIRILSDEDNEVYEYTVDPPLPFQAGDILGLFHPGSRDSQLRLSYDGDATAVYYSQYLLRNESGSSLFDISGKNVITRTGVPLVSAGIGKA